MLKINKCYATEKKKHAYENMGVGKKKDGNNAGTREVARKEFLNQVLKEVGNY